MKKIFFIFLLLLIGLVGCSGNKINVKNLADEKVIFHFRGTENLVSPGEQITITDIPNSGYQYGTLYYVPATATKHDADESLGGTISFFNQSTTISVIYASSTEIVTEKDSLGNIIVVDVVYHIGAILSSSDPAALNPIKP